MIRRMLAKVADVEVLKGWWWRFVRWVEEWEAPRCHLCREGLQSCAKTYCNDCECVMADIAHVRRIQRIAEGKEERP